MKQKTKLEVCSILLCLFCIYGYSQPVTMDGKIIRDIIPVGKFHTEARLEKKDFHLKGKVKSIKTICYSDSRKSERCYDKGNYDQYIEFDKTGYVIIGEGDKFSTLNNTKYFYKYNSTGKLIAKDEYKDGKLYNRIIYTYDTKGNLIKEKKEDDILYYKYTYTPHEKGTEVRKSGVVFDNQTLYTRYIYDKKNNIIENIEYMDNNIISRNVFAYDERGNVTKIEYFGNNNRKTGTYFYTYDEKNRLASQKIDSDFQTDFIYMESYNSVATKNNFSVKLYTFDTFGNLVQEGFYNIGETEPKTTFKYEYEYDQHNNWIKRITPDDSDEREKKMIIREIKYYE